MYVCMYMYLCIHIYIHKYIHTLHTYVRTYVIYIYKSNGGDNITLTMKVNNLNYVIYFLATFYMN